MTTRARGATALSLLTCALLVVVAVQHARALALFGGFGLTAKDVVLFAVLVVLLAGAAAAVHRSQRQGLPPRGVTALGVASAVLALVAVAARDAGEIAYGVGTGGFGGAYSSTLLLDFSAELPWAASVVVVAALGLLPVAGAAAWSGRDGRVRLGSRARLALLAASVAAVVVLLVHLELSVALLGVLRGEAQQLGDVDAVTWVALLWSLVAVVWSARALRRPAVPRLAAVVPLVALAAWGLLLLVDPQRHECCFSYAPLDGSEFVYVPPPLLPDLLLLGGCLLVGVALPLGLQRLRVRTSASTPPG